MVQRALEDMHGSGINGSGSRDHLMSRSAPLLVVIAKNVLLGTVIGSIVGGGINVLLGHSFWEGFENGAFMGAIGGVISGGIGYAFTKGAEGVMLTLSQTLKIGGTVGTGTALFGDLGDMYFRHQKMSLWQVEIDVVISGALGVAFSGIGYGLSKAFRALKLKFERPVAMGE